MPGPCVLLRPFRIRAQFVKPLHSPAPIPCRICKGTGKVECEQCSGQGSLPLGGFHKQNPVNIGRIVGSKWTAMERTLGWRHFEVRAKQRLEKKQWFVEMMASCDQNVRLWVNVHNLKNRQQWSMGWLQRDELLGITDATSRVQCKACKGERLVDCRLCE